MEATVLGAGSWGTAMAIMLARNGHVVRLLARSPEQVEQMTLTRRNDRYLPGTHLPENIFFESMDCHRPFGSLLVEALPSGAVRERLEAMEGYPLICVATKGLEPCGGLLTDLISDAYPQSSGCLISGPNLARELVDGIPTAAIVACRDEDKGVEVRNAFHSPTFRVYYTEDVPGVELAGSLKNVMAMAAGMSDGLGYGYNTKGTLLSRGLAEITRLGMSMGARLETFLGVAGVGDLFATASSTLSRNYRVGRLLAQGHPLDEVLKEIGQVAEGIPTCEAAVGLAERKSIPVPIMQGVLAVSQGRLGAKEVVGKLMERVTLREGIGDIVDSGR